MTVAPTSPPPLDITYYLSGPISANGTHTIEQNLKIFEGTAARLRSDGYSIVSPQEVCDDLIREMKLEGDQTWEWYMRRDLQAMLNDEVTGLALIDGWQQSRGANVEFQLADHLGYTIMPVNYMLRFPKGYPRD